MIARRPRTGRAVATVVLTLAGLFSIGRFALDAWMLKPMPSRFLPGAGPFLLPGSDPLAVGAPRDSRPSPPPLMIGIIDGLRAEAVEPGTDSPMRGWLALAKEGASGIAITGEPTLTTCCVRTILTGRNPDLYTAFRNFDAAAAAGSLTQFLVERGLRAAHAGDAATWQMTRAYYAPEDTLAFLDRGPADQGDTDDQSFPFALGKAKDVGVGLLTFHVLRPDHAGHKHGATGIEYRAACGISDEQMRLVVEAFRAIRPEAYVLLAADHGVTPRGTHGGGEPGARRAPFVLVGPRVAHVAGVTIPQSSLAPTLAVLLGLPVPPLAETGPAVELTTLLPGERAAALDAYLGVRLDVARELGARDIAEAIDARRRQAFRDGPAASIERLAAEYRTLDREAFASVGTRAAVLALLLAAMWMVALVLGIDDERPGGTVTATLAAAIALAAALVASDLWAAGALGAACVLYARPSWGAKASAPRSGRSGAGSLVLASFVAFPILGASGLLLQGAFDATENANPSAVRTAVVLGGLAFLAAGLGLNRDLRRRLLDVFARRPALVAVLGGVALGFTLSLRLFIDPFVHTPILFAAVACVATWLLSRHGAPRDRAIMLAVAGVLFVGGRVMEGLYPDWILTPRAAGVGWQLAAAAGIAILLRHVRRTARSDWPAVVLAVVSLAAACVFRFVSPGMVVAWHLSLAAGLAALSLGAFRGTPDGRLWVRLVAVVALGSLMHDRSDAQWLAIVLLALAALAGARLPSPSGRVGLAALAVGVLAVRIAIFHAMGFTESFSTIDTGGGAVPGAGQAAAEARGQMGLTSEVIVNALLMALKYALVWIALLAAVVRSLERDGRAHLLPAVTADLTIAYAARAAALVAGVWVWWRSSWWASTAYPVFAIALIDVLLLAISALWVRTPPKAIEAAERSASAAVAA